MDKEQELDAWIGALRKSIDAQNKEHGNYPAKWLADIEARRAKQAQKRDAT